MIFRQDGSGKTGTARPLLTKHPLTKLVEEETYLTTTYRDIPGHRPHKPYANSKIALCAYPIDSTVRLCIMHAQCKTSPKWIFGSNINTKNHMSLEPTRSPTQRAPQFSCEGRERSTKRQRQTDRFWEEGELMGVVMGVAMREWWRNGKNQNAVVF